MPYLQIKAPDNFNDPIFKILFKFFNRVKILTWINKTITQTKRIKPNNPATAENIQDLCKETFTLFFSEKKKNMLILKIEYMENKKMAKQKL